MFRDQAKVKFKAGDGGNGKIAFGSNHVPTGGTGGKGGDIYLEGSNSIYDLSPIRLDFDYEAENGQPGGIKNLTGKGGKDLILRVPLTTKVYNEDEKLLHTISQHGQREKLLEGGIGGLGNWFFRSGGIYNADRSTPGKIGPEKTVILRLELQSDIIFIGLPNAGKSSIINTLTNADVKVAAYAFTTLSPHLGRMDDVVLMDLPGLIEKTSEGKGLGIEFEKHTRAAKVVAHFVSLESNDPVADYKLIRSELQAISEDLAAKPEIIILTKSDLIPAAELPSKVKLFKKFKNPTVTVSAYDLDAIEKLRHLFTQTIAQQTQ